MSGSRLASFSRAVLHQPSTKLPFLPLLARPHLELPHTVAEAAAKRPWTGQNLFRSNTRSFSSTPFTSAKVSSPSDFADPNQIRSSHVSTSRLSQGFDWRAPWTREKTQRQKLEERAKAERARIEHEKCEPQMRAFKARLRGCLLTLYRLRYHSHRRRSSTWRPARLCFRTPNFSGVFSRTRRPNRCDANADLQRKHCKRRFELAFFDERRRHQPQRTAHFKYCIGLVRQEVALHFSQGSKAWRDDIKNHQRPCPKRRFMERLEAELGTGGGAEAKARAKHPFERAGHHRHHRAGRGADDSSFDYSTFRRAYWYSKAHSSSRPYNRHRGWRRPGGRLDGARPRAEEWVLRKAGKTRKRAGIAFFTMQESPSARRVQGAEGRGGNGGINRRYADAKVRSIELRFPIARQPSSILRPTARPRITLPVPSPTSLFSRAFSSSRPRFGIHFLVPLATALKSTEALHVLVWVTRLSLTLLPLSVRAKAIFALRQRYLRDPSSLTATVFSRIASSYYSSALAQPSGFLSRWNAFFGLPLLLFSPFLLLGLVAFASLERTPVTGRWRFVMLSPKEEEELVDGILSVGRTAQPATTSHVHNGDVQAVAPESTSLDWVAILRQVLDLPDEGVDPETGRRMLLGGVVLDHRDWRVRWTEAVLRALEKGVVEGLTLGGAGAKGEGEALRPPPMRHLLEGRLGSKGLGEQLQVEYDILVIDRDEKNAFSFGFSPEADNIKEKGRRGVIVVYTGFLKEVLGDTALPSPSTPPVGNNPGRLASFFSRPSGVAQALPEPDPIASYLHPNTLPTQEQCKSLAVLLSHEASHLILSHTLESYASMNLLMPHLTRLASDVVRTLLYPVTMILGPFINDALGKSFNEGAKAGFGFFGHAANSCESRKLESEADLVALRLLAGSGIDPRFALDFWENRLATPSSSPSTTLPFSQTSPVHHHSKNSGDDSSSSATGMLDGYMRTHPVDRERLDRIRTELKSWEDWNRSHT